MNLDLVFCDSSNNIETIVVIQSLLLSASSEDIYVQMECARLELGSSANAAGHQ